MRLLFIVLPGILCLQAALLSIKNEAAFEAAAMKQELANK